MTRPPRATIVDVASAAGVSRQTVTRAMNGMAEISDETRQRVLAVARELRYRPSRFGRDLVKREQRTLGLIIHDLTNPYYPELASSVVGAASARGWSVVLADTVHSRDRAADLAGLVRQVDAVVGYPWMAREDAEEIFAGVPFVHIDASPDAPFGAIELDVTAATGELATHLLDAGVRHPVALMTSPVSPRGVLFRERMADGGVDVRIVAARPESVASGLTATGRLIRSGEPFDAILAFNDLMACGALKALREAGIDVPGRVRVAGIDGLSLGTVVTPELTTLAIDMTEVAGVAVDLAVRMFDGELPLSGSDVRRRIPHRLVVRESA